MMTQQQDSPIFIIGRQHSGNTMLATILGQAPEVFCLKGEGIFFEHWRRANQLAPGKKARQVFQLIRDGANHSQNVPDDLLGILRNEAQNDVAAHSLYALGMTHLAEQQGAARWAQKATSYVFHVDSILDVFPEARLLFLVRNPLDLAASKRRRHGSDMQLVRTVWGWNQGVRLAQEYQQTHPERVLLIRYEDLVQQPLSVSERVFDFIDLSFDSSYTQVDHVNRSETPYNDTSQQHGINESRVFYYPGELSPEEEQCVRTLSNRSLLSALYADLPPPRMPSTFRHLPTMMKLLVSGGVHLATDHWRQFRAAPRHAIRRVYERLR